MKKTLAVLLLTFSCHSFAAKDDLRAAVSGFVSATMFSDSDFYEHSARGAVNLDVSKGSYLFHAQMASSTEFPTETLISRLTFEKVFGISEGNEMSIIVGRFPRLYSFYNAITDNVGTSGLAMLPLSQYKRRTVADSRMISGDGIMLNYRFHHDDYSIEFTADVSQASKINNCMIHMEFYNKPCGYAYGFVSDNPNYDFGLTYEDKTLKVLLAVIEIDIKAYITDRKDPVALATYTVGNRWQHKHYKFGFIKQVDDWWVQAEGTYRNILMAGVGKKFVPYNQQIGGDFVVGYHVNNDISAYAGYSLSRSAIGDGKFNLDDHYVGATYANGDGFTYSLEYHIGRGRDWNRYLSPDDNWSSAVFSISKQF
jgi:hypothetical protein